MPLTGTAEQGSSRGELHGRHGSPVVAADGLALVVAWRYLGRHDGPKYQGFGGPSFSLSLSSLSFSPAEILRDPRVSRACYGFVASRYCPPHVLCQQARTAVVAILLPPSLGRWGWLTQPRKNIEGFLIRPRTYVKDHGDLRRDHTTANNTDSSTLTARLKQR